MHVLGKVLLVFVGIGGLAAMALTARLLDIRNQWQKKLNDVEAQVVTARESLDSKRDAVRKAELALEAIRAETDLQYVSVLDPQGRRAMTWAGQPLDLEIGEVQVGVGTAPTAGGLVPAADGQQGSPIVHIFDVTNPGTSKYLGEFQASPSAITESSTTFQRLEPPLFNNDQKLPLSMMLVPERDRTPQEQAVFAQNPDLKLSDAEFKWDDQITSNGWSRGNRVYRVRPTIPESSTFVYGSLLQDMQFREQELKTIHRDVIDEYEILDDVKQRRDRTFAALFGQDVVRGLMETDQLNAVDALLDDTIERAVISKEVVLDPEAARYLTELKVGYLQAVRDLQAKRDAVLEDVDGLRRTASRLSRQVDTLVEQNRELADQLPTPGNPYEARPGDPRVSARP